MDIIFRDVVRWRVYTNYDGAYTQREGLTCGHEIHNKGSVGRASRRRCKECEGLRKGKKISYPELGFQEVWNPDTEMPIKLPVE